MPSRSVPRRRRALRRREYGAGRRSPRAGTGDIALVRGGPDHLIAHEPGAHCVPPGEFHSLLLDVLVVLLLAQEATLNQIAANVGYSSVYGFTTAFRRHNGELRIATPAASPPPALSPITAMRPGSMPSSAAWSVRRTSPAAWASSTGAG
jgi:AraC-like DNA-binding protein